MKNNYETKKDNTSDSIKLLVDSIISIVDRKIRESTYDRTVEGTIIKKTIKNNKTIYTVRYNNNQYDVSSSIGEVKSKNVWLKIPCNNINKIHICGIR